MTVAETYFEQVDSNLRLGLTSIDDLWDWIDDGAVVGLVSGRAWDVESSDGVFFRGQPSVAYGLSSKLYRDCKVEADMRERPAVSEADLAAVERTLLDSMGEEGIGRNMTEGQMLMVMQHHGIATRLLDVSEGPKEALFFACDKHPEQDGRLFVIALAPHSEGYDSMELAYEDELPWLDAARGRYAASDWSSRVAVIEDGPVDPRMIAQAGRFLVGGLARRYAGKHRWSGGRSLAARSYLEVSTLDINFLKVKTRSHNEHWGASGWTVLIPAEWKAELMVRLSEVDDPITSDTMYPPVNEVSRLARRLVRDYFKR